MRILNMEWVRHCRSSSSACPYESIDRRWSPRRNKIFKGNCPCTYFAWCSILFRPMIPHLTFLTILFGILKGFQLSQHLKTSSGSATDPTSFIPAVTTDFRLKKSFLYTSHQRSRYPFWMRSTLCSCLILIGVLEWQTRVSSTLNANQDRRKLARPITIAL